VIVYLAVGILTRDWRALPVLLRDNRAGVAAFVMARIFEVAWKGCLVRLVWAGADYFLERQRHENDLKMTRQEQKDEFKETEGNPAVKQRIRRLRVLQQLLREQVSIRDLPTILEAVLDVAPTNKNPVLLVETARQALGRALVRPLLTDGGGLRVVTLDRALEDELGRAFGGAAPAGTGAIQPSFARRISDGLRKLAGEQVALASPVLLCATPVRYHLKRLLEPFLPKITVLSPMEIPPVVEVQSVGVLK
jgi:flagellar biosynthesis component FlhA